MTSVAFLVDQLFGPFPGGQGTYIRELIPALSRADPSLQITLFHSSSQTRDLVEPWTKPYRIESISGSIKRLYPSWALLGRPALPPPIDGADIVHAPTPAGVPPAGRTHRSVVTVHDVAFLARPDLFHWRWRLVYRAGLARAVRTADAIIVVSNYTAEDLVSRTKVDGRKVHVVPLAASLPPSHYDVADAAKSFKIRPPYVLCVGTLEPRKNLIALVHAYRRLAARGWDHALVLSGGIGWHFEPLRQLLSEDGPGQVVVTGMVSPFELDALYRGATALVYPSLYEGFGLPVLEAMARGIPCIVSNTTSLPEVADDAALFIDPESVDDIAAAMEKVTTDGAFREDLRKSGLARAAEFSWDETARKTLEVYESLV